MPLVSVSLGGGAARTCRATRQADGTLHLGLTGFAMVGVDATLLWTQNNRGCSIDGTVIAPPAGGLPGVYLRIDGVAGGIQRRRTERVRVQMPAVVLLPSGQLFPGRTVDLSAGGAHVTVDLEEMSEDSLMQLLEDLERDALIEVQIELPDGPVGLTCQVRAGGDEPGDVRLLFVNVNADVRERVARFVTASAATVAG
ncbi:PilZ domain-containing protein [Actinoplanes ianthinogenes]|uniref:PilZ domain-containing protein n=1 Tax=Actinoplanes ianthinogenes TaxID=122358 RepID=UPI001E427792|nr:PilZ domain-containing protein [Actinoplanes ianthinogenes]